MRRIDFEAPTHRYRLNGQRAPGVTSVLRGAMQFAGVDPAVVEAACQRGTVVHKAVELINRGQRIDPASIDVRIKPYLRQYGKFLTDTGFVAANAERFVSHVRLHYCGQLDMDGTFHRIKVPAAELELLDLKVTAALPTLTVGMQTAGYAGALEDELGRARRNRWCLWLRPDTYKLVPLTGANDWTEFSAALTIWRKFYAHGIEV